jgi:putative FmdB family regulatory protein
MALYDFVCLDCGKSFELFVQGFIKEEQKHCPSCGSVAVRQKFSSFLSTGASSDSACVPRPGSAFR